jgi:hypothetical protein
MQGASIVALLDELEKLGINVEQLRKLMLREGSRMP